MGQSAHNTRRPHPPVNRNGVARAGGFGGAGELAILVTRHSTQKATATRGMTVIVWGMRLLAHFIGSGD